MCFENERDQRHCLPREESEWSSGGARAERLVLQKGSSGEDTGEFHGVPSGVGGGQK